MKKSISFVMVNGILAMHVTNFYTDGSQFEIVMNPVTGEVFESEWVKPIKAIRAVKPDEVLQIKQD